jgi:glucokinase
MVYNNIGVERGGKMKKYVYGIDVGGTNVKFGLFQTDNMTLLEKFERKTPTLNQRESVFKLIYDTILSTNKQYGFELSDLEGIGLAVPCPVRNGYVSACANVGWNDINIKNIMESMFHNELRILVSNDANLAAYGENESLDSPYKNAVLITLGTGVGGGIILNGEILEGSTGMGGEIGHTHVYDGPIETCGCGKKGCLEQMCASKGMLNYAKELSHSMETSIQIEDMNIKDIFDAAKQGDQLGLKVVERAAEYLGRSASIVALTIDPDVFIIGGGISKAGQFFIDLVKKAYEKYARFSTNQIPFILAKTGNDAGIIGAAYYTIKHK